MADDLKTCLKGLKAEFFFHTILVYFSGYQQAQRRLGARKKKGSYMCSVCVHMCTHEIRGWNFFFFSVLRIEPMASHMLGMCSITT